MQTPILRFTTMLAAGILLAACAISRKSASKTGVDISGVNYSDMPITYIVSDPNDTASVGAEPLDPFAAGGAMCCFRLPATWQPGIKVKVEILDTHREPFKEEILELPPYVDGKPGRLWAVLYQDGSIEVLSSEYGPPHAKWPGKVKGWPVPTVEYRRKLWAMHLDLKMGTLRAAQKLVQELRESPEKRLQESWKHKQQYSRKDIATFTGPADPAYREFLSKDYEQFLIDAQRDVDEWVRAKP
ncbi:DUF3304 domain-containing protein [Noviherbaspirillum sp. ST9]|uniref:DUF3304 domain-containing protein n=1 Tax=Noviherbaspirillum sp. ST9 TaxID=3401606 RepID=UPI003B589EDF